MDLGSQRARARKTVEAKFCGTNLEEVGPGIKTLPPPSSRAIRTP
jgi:hypothetical protein